MRANGGDAKVFSSLHVSGEQLSKFGGVAAVLRFPLVLEEAEEEAEAEEAAAEAAEAES